MHGSGRRGEEVPRGEAMRVSPSFFFFWAFGRVTICCNVAMGWASSLGWGVARLDGGLALWPWPTTGGVPSK